MTGHPNQSDKGKQEIRTVAQNFTPAVYSVYIKIFGAHYVSTITKINI